MANTDKNIVITPNIGSSTADPNIVFTGGNTTVANSINMTMYASGTLSWDGTAGQLFSITNSLTGVIFSVNDISGIPSITVNSLGNIVLAQYGGNVTVGGAQGSASNVFSVAGNAYVSGNSYVAQTSYTTGNINVSGSRSLFLGAVGIGTSTAAGMIAASGVSNDAYVWGNVRIANTSATSSGLIFSDGTRQTTAGTNTPSFGAVNTVQLAGAGNTFTGDTDTFNYDTTNNRLGIGTVTPGQTLSVYGTEAVLFNSRPGGAARQEITVGNVTTYGAVLGYDPSIGNSIGYLRRGDSAAGTPAITWAYGTGAYRVGVNGVTQPQNTMDISGTVAIGSGFSGFAVMTNTNGLSVQGAVGVGTFTPSTSANNMTLWSATGAGIELASGGAAGGGNIQAATGGGLKFSTFTGGVGAEVYTNRMVIDSGGQVGIGLADALSAFDVNGISSFRSFVSVADTAIVNSLVSNVYGVFGQNVTINSTNASTTTGTGALVITTGGLGVGGNINVGGANSLFTNRVGIGTSTVLGARANVLSVYGSVNNYGNIVISNATAGGSGIYFPDGTFQNSAAGGLGITRQTFTATAGQTTFAVLYVVGFIDVYQNGSKLNVGTDVTASNGTSIVLTIAADAGDTIETLTNTVFEVANALQISGGTISGQLLVADPTASTSTGTGALTVNGGTGIGGNINVGGSVNYIAGNLSVGTTSSLARMTVSTNTAPPLSLAGNLGSAQILMVGSDAVTTRFVMDSYGANNNFSFRRAQGTATLPTAMTTGQGLGSIAGFGYGATGYSSIARALITLTANENWTDTAQGTYIAFLSTPNTTTAVTEYMRLTGTGNLLLNSGGTTQLNGNTQILVGGVGTNGGGIQLAGGTAGGGTVESINGGGLTFDTYTGVIGGETYTERMRIISTGNVGIGSSTPIDLLNVFNGNITVGNGNTGNATVISPSYVTLTRQGNIPAIPAAGDMQVFAKNVGTRSMLSQQGASGIDTSIQPLIGKNRVYYWSAPGLNTTTAPVASYGATIFTAVGTATARAFATTNIRTRMTRVGYVSVATIGGLASLRVATAWLTTGTGTGLGGVFYICRFGVSDAAAVAGARMFVGLSSNTAAATNVEPATQLNQFGIAQISTDNTQWYFVYGGSVAQAAIPLGTALGAPTLTTTSWDLALFSSPGSNGVVGYTVTNIGTGASVTGSITPATPGTQTPANTTALTFQMWRTNNTTALAVAIDFMSLYIETDD